MIEEQFQAIAGMVALAIEAVVVGILAFAAAEATFGIVRAVAARGRRADSATGARRAVWFRFALWIILSLEFALAADIIRTAIAPSWQSIGQLGAIAAIRTFLNFFLMQDVEAYGSGRKSATEGVENHG